MKKFLAILSLAGLVLTATSCSKDNVSPSKTAIVTADKNDVGTNQMPPP